MDYTKIPRSLIYVDKRDLEEFRVDDKDTLNGKLYDMIMDYTDIPTFDSAENIVLDCFNNAYYTIMLILHTKRPELHLGAYIDAMKPYGGYHQTAQQSMLHITFYIVDLYLIVLQEDWKSCALRKHLHQWKRDLDDPNYISFDYNELHSSAVYTDDFKPCSIVDGIKNTCFIGSLCDGMNYVRDEVRKLKDKELQHQCIDKAMGLINLHGDTEPIIKARNRLKTLSQELFGTEVEQPKEENEETKEKGKGLTPEQSALFTFALAKYLNFSIHNKKEQLGPLASKLFGWGESSMKNKMYSFDKDDAEKVAKLFDDFDTKFAEHIRTIR